MIRGHHSNLGKGKDLNIYFGSNRKYIERIHTWVGVKIVWNDAFGDWARTNDQGMVGNNKFNVVKV